MILQFGLLALAAPLTVGYLVSPPGAATPGTTSDCSKWVEYSPNLTCASIEEEYGITQEEFESWNPLTGQLGSSCSLLSGFSYCVQVDFISNSPAPSPTSSTTTSTTTSIPTTIVTSTTRPTTTTTTAGNGISTPTPIQPGMANNCDSFHMVVSGDTCAAIASSAGVSLADFEKWNPSVGSACSSLWAGYYVCTGLKGTSSTTAPATTTSAGNGITTPTPVQQGIAKNCDKFVLVGSGDNCASIASNNGISLSNFYAWNPAVGNDCSSLWLGYHVCVDVLGHTAPTTTTSSGNGIATPTPIEPGMTKNCNKFWLVGSGDRCAKIASKEGVTVAQIEAWNPRVGGTCSSLWLGYYICVGVL